MDQPELMVPQRTTDDSNKETPLGSRVQGSLTQDSPDIRISRVEGLEDQE